MKRTRNNFAIARSWSAERLARQESFVVLPVDTLRQMQEMMVKAAVAAQASVGGMQALYAEAFRRASAQVEDGAPLRLQ